MTQYPNPAIIINSFVNPRNSVNGYASRYMIPRKDTPIFQGLAGSVCIGEKHLLRWKNTPEGVRIIDQSKLAWVPPTTMNTVDDTAPVFR